MKKTIFTILFLGSILYASANDVYVSATGNDSNNGLSATTAFATFGKALTVVEDGGIVHISGFLYACDDDANPLPSGDVNKSGYAITKNVTVLGTNKATDGFIGYNDVTWNTTRFFSLNTGGTLTLKNLTLKDSYATSRGGAVYVNGGTLIAEDVNFERCEAETSGSDAARGGAIEVEKTLGLTFKRCLFKQNVAPKGGAFYIQDTGNPNVEIRFEACSFVGNKSTQGGASCGGLFFRLVSENVTVNIINSTFSGNINAGNGGTIYVYGAQASNKFNVINSTIVDNIGRSAGGSGAGFSVETQGDEARKPVISILNSIIEGNAVADGSSAEDLVYGYEPAVDKLNVRNSFIGKVYVMGAGMINPDSYVGTLYWDYMTRTFNRAEILSGIGILNQEFNVYPLNNGATALNYGNATFLQNIGITTDQLGTTRIFADGKCSVGSMEGVGMPPASGVHYTKLPENVKVYKSQDYLLIQDLSSSPIHAELFSISGQAIVSEAAVGKVSLPTFGLKGVYIIKISSSGETFSHKVVIN